MLLQTARDPPSPKNGLQHSEVIQSASSTGLLHALDKHSRDLRARPRQARETQKPIGTVLRPWNSFLLGVSGKKQIMK